MKRTTIKLKTNSKGISYYITDISEEEKLNILAHKKDLKQFSIDLNDGINYETIERLGETCKIQASNITPYVTYLKGYAPSLTGKPRKIQFRDYRKTEEEQLETAWLVATCEDSYSSARSVITSLRKKYSIIWTKIETEN